MGPEPTALLNVVSANALRTEILNTLVGWGYELLEDPEPYRNRFSQAFIVLHFCRMLQDLDEGRVTSKREGAEWAKTKLDPKWIPLIDYCWNDRQDTEIHISQPAVPEIFDEVLAFVAGAWLSTLVDLRSRRGGHHDDRRERSSHLGSSAVGQQSDPRPKWPEGRSN